MHNNKWEDVNEDIQETLNKLKSQVEAKLKAKPYQKFKGMSYKKQMVGMAMQYVVMIDIGDKNAVVTVRFNESHYGDQALVDAELSDVGNNCKQQ